MNRQKINQIRVVSKISIFLYPYSSNFPYSSKPFAREEQPVGTYDSLNDRMLISSPIKDNEMESNNSSVYSDGIRSHIIGDAGEDFSLL